MLGYRAQSNFIHTGSIDDRQQCIRRRGERAGHRHGHGQRTQLGHASSLQSGQRIPDGKRYHGSPAQETRSDIARSRSTLFPAQARTVQAIRLLVLFAIAFRSRILLLDHWEHYCRRVLRAATRRQRRCARRACCCSPWASFSAPWWRGCLPFISFRAFANSSSRPTRRISFMAFITGCKASSTLQQFALLQSAVRRQLHHRALHAVPRLESEHGRADRLEFRHQPAARQPVPLRDWQPNDGLGRAVHDQHPPVELIVPARQTRIGEHNYLGNNIHYPPDGRTGSNCLLGTKVMIPIEGPCVKTSACWGRPASRFRASSTATRPSCSP